jgi:aminoglycoside phosphotransferase (APT) family kinase protein
MHAGQLTVTPEIVQRLLAEQFPRWRDLPVTRVGTHGTVNAVFRVGERFAARFLLEPRDVESARRTLTTEADAARELAGRTRFRTPEPVALGEPGAGYPLPWLVQTWLPGATGNDEDPAASVEFARDLAEFVQDVRKIDKRGRVFSGEGRGGDLRSHDEWLETCFRHSETLLDVPPLRRLWATMRELPHNAADDVMCHGDLLPGNVLVSGGRLTGVIDVGGFGPADPALDLICAWNLLDSGPRKTFRAVLGCDDLEWERGRAWAFQQAMGLVWYYVETNPLMSKLGRRTLARITADPR